MTQVDRRQILKGGLALGAASVVFGPRAAFADHDKKGALYRWDIPNLGFPGPLCAEEGGEASSKALDGSRITITGSGTFRDGPECSKKVTGGGTWRITPGTLPTPPAGSGTYKVTRFVSFTPADGALPINDCIGNVADARAGRLTLAIRFNDGSEGVLEIGCRLFAVGDEPASPDEIMEGITATKGFATFWNHEEPVAGVDGNRTLFHVLRRGDDDDDEEDD